MGNMLERHNRSYRTANRGLFLVCFALAVLFSLPLLAGSGYVAREGRAESVIVLNGNAKGLYPYLIWNWFPQEPYLEYVVNFHHGKPYLKKVHWEKVFSVLPVRHPHPLFP